MVTKQEQLEWLVKWWHKWPKYLPFVLMSKIREGCAISDSASSDIGYYKVTRKEWQQERDKMQNQKDNSWHERGVCPPIGAPAELWLGGSFTYNCEFMCVRGNNYIVWNLDADRPDCADIMNSKFRPIRTEREKAIDEMADLIAKSVFGSAKCQAEKLYDAGYRKQ